MASNDGSVLERISKNNVLFSACHSVVNGLFCNLFIVHSFSPQIVTEQLWCTERSSRLCDHLWPSPIVAPLSSVNHNPTTRSIHIRAPLCFFCSHPSPGLHLLPSRSLPRSLIFTTPICPVCRYGCVTPLLKTLPCPQGQTQPLLPYKIGCDPATPYLSPSFPIPPNFNILFYLLIFGCDGSGLRHAGFPLVVAWRFGSRSTWALSRRHEGFSSRGAWTYLPCGMWDLSSLTRDRTSVPWIGRQIPEHWTTREFPPPDCHLVLCALAMVFPFGSFNKPCSLLPSDFFSPHTFPSTYKILSVLLLPGNFLLILQISACVVLWGSFFWSLSRWGPTLSLFLS